MVSALRVLARTRSLYGAAGQLDSSCSYRRGDRKRSRRKFITCSATRPPPDLALLRPQATKVTVGIVPSENAEVEELREWKVDDGEIRADPRIAREILEFIEERRVRYQLVALAARDPRDLRAA